MGSVYGQIKTRIFEIHTKNLDEIVNFDQGWGHLAYTNDGDYLFAGGKSFMVVMYSVKARHVIGQYSITSNVNLDGLLEFLDSKTTMTEFGALADISDAADVKLAGQKKSDRSLRRFDVSRTKNHTSKNDLC